MTAARHVVVSGIVQGVGYRYAAQREARRLGIVGWVRNTNDGAVEAWIQGTEQSIEEMTSFLWTGPRFADVAAVDVSQTEPDPSLTSFDVTV